MSPRQQLIFVLGLRWRPPFLGNLFVSKVKVMERSATHTTLSWHSFLIKIITLIYPVMKMTLNFWLRYKQDKEIKTQLSWLNLYLEQSFPSPQSKI
jgi:hypothetical protein